MSSVGSCEKTQPDVSVRHAFSVDVEDWYQLALAEGAEISRHFEENIASILETLENNRTGATFFILGLTAEKAPGVIKSIAAAGHEVQSHGYSHRSNFEMSEQELHRDLLKARGLIEDICGRRVDAYRAPCFTVDERNIWALDVLAETGHVYDSSVFPVKTSRYGIRGYPPGPSIVTTRSERKIVEAPVACFDWLGRRWPVGGGGYFRFWPYFMIRKAWRQLERQGRPGIVYMHPYEYDPIEMHQLRGKVPWTRRLHQGLGRKEFPRKVDRLLSEFKFTTMGEVLAELLGDRS